MQVEYTEYIFLKIKFVYLDELYIIDRLIKTKSGFFDFYDGDPYDPNYTKKINSYYRRFLDSSYNYVPKLIYSDFYYTDLKYSDKYNDIISEMLQPYDNIDIVTITREKERKVKHPRLRFIYYEP
jgi:hypothetical protein